MIDHQALASWYSERSRDLPWRRDPTPYRVLLSEFLCQQTRVETALPYFQTFCERWPSVEALADASVDEVVEAWAGLGYYSRARNLHRTAQVIRQAGAFPSTAAELVALPGVGPYTAGAIASIAFSERAPAVDGNIGRVLSRWYALEESPASSRGKRVVWEHASAVHRDSPANCHPGDLNQALMELGARICTPRSPECGACPISAGCLAHQTGRTGEIPRPKTRKPPVPISGIAGVLRTSRGVLMVKRPHGGLLGGLWSPPVVMEPETNDPACLLDAFARAGVEARVGQSLGTVVHIFSHRRLSAAVYEVEGQGEPRPGRGWADARWSADRGGLSGLGRKILELAEQADEVLPLLAADSRRS